MEDHYHTKVVRYGKPLSHKSGKIWKTTIIQKW